MPVGERRTAERTREWPETARAMQQLSLLRGMRAEARYAAAAAAEGGPAHRTLPTSSDVLLEPCPLLAEDLAEFGGWPSSGAMSDREEDDDVLQDGPQGYPAPSSSSFLQIGQVFAGKQKVTHVTTHKREWWGVVVRIQGMDLSRGYVCGTMEARNVPESRSPVVTFWEGEVIDNINHSFMTWKWHASRDVDLLHWSRFDAFKPLRAQVERSAGRCARLAGHSHVFLRLKEQFFIDQPDDCRLTIAGFYYVCLSRADGRVEGLYFDKSSSPYQRLDLRPVQCGQVAPAGAAGSAGLGRARDAAPVTGHAFTTYELR